MSTWNARQIKAALLHATIKNLKFVPYLLSAYQFNVVFTQNATVPFLFNYLNALVCVLFFSSFSPSPGVYIGEMTFVLAEEFQGMRVHHLDLAGFSN